MKWTKQALIEKLLLDNAPVSEIVRKVKCSKAYVYNTKSNYKKKWEELPLKKKTTKRKSIKLHETSKHKIKRLIREVLYELLENTIRSAFRSSEENDKS